MLFMCTMLVAVVVFENREFFAMSVKEFLSMLVEEFLSMSVEESLSTSLEEFLSMQVEEFLASNGIYRGAFAPKNLVNCV